MIKNFTFGTDPEFFILNTRLGLTLSAIPLIKGTKEEPESLGDGFFILHDNVLVEGNVPPADTAEGFIRNMAELKKRIRNYISNKFPEYENFITLLADDCQRLDPMFLNHPDSLQFGCSPYLNAWDNEIHKANDMSASMYRTAGFHIHIGYELSTYLWKKEEINKIIAKAFDLFVTIPSYNTYFDPMRFENYGGLGNYRNTPYGIECRSLGGYFTEEEYVPWVIRQVEKMLNFIDSETHIYTMKNLEKPIVNIKNGNFTFDSSIYEEIDLSYNDQLFKEIDKIYAYND